MDVPKTPLDRRAFFSEGFRRVFGKAVEVVGERISGGAFVRPPGALPEPAFLGACTRCGECTGACPVHAIRPLGTEHGLAAATPVLELSVQACVMCTDMPCAAVCPTDALTVPEDGWRSVRMSRITIDEERCIAFQGTECGACARVCPVGDAALSVDERTRPALGDACTGCGVCISACVTTPRSIIAASLGGLR
jgi:MauM/NapG family ferredoxin protein